MKDTILKWWNRKWSNWEFDRKETMNTPAGRKLYCIDFYKKTSNDGLVKYKKIKN